MLHLTVVSSPPPPHHLHHHVPISSASAGDGLQSLSSTVLAVVIVCGSCVRNSVRDSLRVHTYPAVSVSTNRLCPPHRKACVVLRCSCKIEIYIYLFSFFFFKVHSPVFCAVQVLRFSSPPPPPTPPFQNLKNVCSHVQIIYFCCKFPCSGVFWG